MGSVSPVAQKIRVNRLTEPRREEAHRRTSSAGRRTRSTAVLRALGKSPKRVPTPCWRAVRASRETCTEPDSTNPLMKAPTLQHPSRAIHGWTLTSNPWYVGFSPSWMSRKLVLRATSGKINALQPDSPALRAGYFGSHQAAWPPASRSRPLALGLARPRHGWLVGRPYADTAGGCKPHQVSAPA